MKVVNLIILLSFVFIVFYLLGGNLYDIYSGVTTNNDIKGVNSSDYIETSNITTFDLMSDLNISYEVIKDVTSKKALDHICGNYS